MNPDDINKAVAEKIMGWEYVGACRSEGPGWRTDNGVRWGFRPLINNDDFDLMLDTLRDQGHNVQVTTIATDRYGDSPIPPPYTRCRVFEYTEPMPRWSDAICHNRKKAVCTAALRAKGVEID